MAERLLRKRKVAERLGVSVATLWRMAQADPDFPHARQLRGGLTGYLESEVEAYVVSRPLADSEGARSRVAAALAARGIGAEGNARGSA